MLEAADNTVLYDEKIKATQKKKALCTRVEQTLKTKGWKEIIKPLLDKMIKDVVGGKYGDEWDAGAVGRAKKEDKIHYYLGYKDALIKLHNEIMKYPKAIKKYDDDVKGLIEEKQAKTSIPLVEE